VRASSVGGFALGRRWSPYRAPRSTVSMRRTAQHKDRGTRAVSTMPSTRDAWVYPGKLPWAPWAALLASRLRSGEAVRGMRRAVERVGQSRR
jgi:hypothetical protein